MKLALGFNSHCLFSSQTCRALCPFFKPSPSVLPKPKTPFLLHHQRSIREGFCYRWRAMSTSLSSMTPVQVKDSINLTDKERQIFDRLLQVLRHFNLRTQLRVAGGWVRDKLLGKECCDIDIALDNMLGREFCEKVNEYFISAGEETQGIGVIQCNPDQSKHLETARMHIFDIWIDFVNLRSEDYNETSRIPTMRFGTAEDDAYRRDLTINSLFYNINTNSVEDFTGRGLADLKFGKIVTPLPPKETFLDDPLRVLRAIRFGARFGFMLDEGLQKAAADDDVRVSLADKISRERIGHEIDLMMSGNQPVKAMSYILDFKLFWVVFHIPSVVEPPASEGCDRACVSFMDYAWRLVQLVGCSSLSDEQRRLSLYAALLLPFRKTVYKDNRAKKVPVVSYVFRNSLKLKSSDAETVISLHIAIGKFVSLIPFLVSNDDSKIVEVDWKREIVDVAAASRLRVLAGLLLREIKELWRVALFLSMLLYPTSVDCCTSSTYEQFELNKRIELFDTCHNAIIKLGLDKIWEVKPLLNGKEIMSVLQIKTGGPLVREWQQKLHEWQLAFPSGTAEECIDWMRQAHTKRVRTE